MIPHSRPIFDSPFAESIQPILASGHTASGLQCKQLEQHLSQQIGCADAIAVDSGSNAIMLAIRALSAQKSIQRVGIPAYACASLLFAVRAAGCTPICMDCQDDLRLDVDKAWALAPSLDAVILVHPFGMIEPLVKETWPCPIIEDIAQAAGAMLDKKPLGSFGDITIASFYATKPWGGAYGGMLLSSPEICTHVRAMINPDTAHFDQCYVGHHQLSDIHAALAWCRIKQSQQEHNKRQEMMQWLDTQLPQTHIQSIKNRQHGNAFRYIIRSKDNAKTTIQKLQQYGIGAMKPVQQPLHLGTGEACDAADQAWQDCISLPLLPTMSDKEYEQYTYGLKACFTS